MGTTVSGKTPGQYFASLDHLKNVAGHAAVGGAVSMANGGDFASGALSAGFGAAVSPATFLLNQQMPYSGLATTVAVGGATSALAGGDAGQGAWTAAMGYLYNAAIEEFRLKIPSTDTVPGGPWTQHDADRPGQFLGPKSDGGGGRSQLQFVPAEGEGGPPGSQGYWKVNEPGQKGWQRYDLNGNPISPAEAHSIPVPKVPSLRIPALICPACSIVPNPFNSDPKAIH